MTWSCRSTVPLATSALVWCLIVGGCEYPFAAEYEKFRSIVEGMSEAQVLERLGPPTRIYHKADAPKDYYVNGHSREERAITNKVFIYIGSEPIAYVYFDETNNVQHVFVGGS